MTEKFDGHCPICEQAVAFELHKPNYFRSLQCPNCRSAPRNRDLFYTLNKWFPDWRNKVIHECSPGWDSVTGRLMKECKNYIATQYNPKVPFGQTVEAPRLLCGKYRSENLEKQTFGDGTFDLVVMQDVFEHVFDPCAAAKEIARTLKPNGALVMSVPVVNKIRPTVRRASLDNGEVRYHSPPEYHGNPVDEKGSIVTFHWGYDIGTILAAASGLHCIVMHHDILPLGIRDECNEIIVGLKSISILSVEQSNSVPAI